MSHYYKTDNDLKDQDIIIDYVFKERRFNFKSNSGVFSKDEIDQGSQWLLHYLTGLNLHGSLLDVGCGYGVLGITLKTLYPELSVTMIDVNERALASAKENCQINKAACLVLLSDGYQNIEGCYDYIITNPPIRAGKRVVYSILGEAFHHLNKGGSLVAVIRKNQGALSALSHVQACFGNGIVGLKKKGYYIITAIKE